MVVNFRAHEISRDIHKLARISTLIYILFYYFLKNNVIWLNIFLKCYFFKKINKNRLHNTVPRKCWKLPGKSFHMHGTELIEAS